MLKFSNALQHIMLWASSMVLACCSVPAADTDSDAQTSSELWRVADMEALKYHNTIYIFEIKSGRIFDAKRQINDSEFADKLNTLSNLSPKPVLILKLKDDQIGVFPKKIMKLVENKYGCKTGKCFLLRDTH